MAVVASNSGSIESNEGNKDNDINQWYRNLAIISQHLIVLDPQLQQVFTSVNASGFQLHTVIKPPYVALVGAIIGQLISYKTAKKLRGELYTRYGTNFTPLQLLTADLSFLSPRAAVIINDVTQYIVHYNIDLNTEEGIRSLHNVSGIGSWTIDTTLLTCLKHWNLFPLGDVFLQNRMKRLYGVNCDMAAISERWSPYKSIVTWYLWRWF